MQKHTSEWSHPWGEGAGVFISHWLRALCRGGGAGAGRVLIPLHLKPALHRSQALSQPTKKTFKQKPADLQTGPGTWQASPWRWLKSQSTEGALPALSTLNPPKELGSHQHSYPLWHLRSVFSPFSLLSNRALFPTQALYPYNIWNTGI